MSENAFLPTCSKKRKIEYVFEGDNTDEPLLSHDYSYDNQQTESQQTATELFDLTRSGDCPPLQMRPKESSAAYLIRWARIT